MSRLAGADVSLFIRRHNSLLTFCLAGMNHEDIMLNLESLRSIKEKVELVKKSKRDPIAKAFSI